LRKAHNYFCARLDFSARKLRAAFRSWFQPLLSIRIPPAGSHKYDGGTLLYFPDRLNMKQHAEEWLGEAIIRRYLSGSVSVNAGDF